MRHSVPIDIKQNTIKIATYQSYPECNKYKKKQIIITQRFSCNLDEYLEMNG